MSRTMRTVLLVLLAAYVSGVLVITLWPSTATTPGAAGVHDGLAKAQSDGAPEAFSWASMEKVANLLVFVPIGAAVAMLVPHRLWMLGAAAGFALSAFIEATQFLFLPGRDSSWRDLFVNTAGALIGAVLVAAVVRARGVRARRVPAEGS